MLALESLKYLKERASKEYELDTFVMLSKTDNAVYALI